MKNIFHPKRLVIIVLCVISLSAALWAGNLFLNSSPQEPETTNQLNTTKNPTEEESTETIEVTQSKEKLQTIVDEMEQTYGEQVGIVVTDLSNGATAAYNRETLFISASIYKLFVAYGIYQRIDAGSIALTDTLERYNVSKSVESCLDAMLTISDNECAVALGKLFGWDALDTMLHAQGYTSTTLNNYDGAGTIISDKHTNANDVAKLLQALYDGSLVSESSTESFLTFLKADKINYMLPSGLPDGAIIAHKVGYLNDYQHDAGIIYGTTKDILVVMLTKGWQTNPAAEAVPAFKQLSGALWDYSS